MKKLYTILMATVLIWPYALMSQVNISVLNKAIVQNFDSLARNGTSTVMPAGWHLYQTNGTLTYRANIGDSARANVYSYGRTGFAGLNRALGSISSGTNTTYFGAEYVNNTGYVIDQLTISYTIEQWRLGATGRGADTTEFDYSTNATGLTSSGATWVNVSNLDMLSPVTSGTPGPLAGNTIANQSKVSYKLSGLSIGKGAHFWVRWYDHAIKGANDGLAVENFSILPYSSIAGPTVVTKINSGKFPQVAGIPDTTVYGKFHGIVLSPNFVSNGGLQFSIRDSFANSGFQPGIGAITCISATDLGGYKVAIGDSVYVTGKIRSFKYLTYIQMDTLILIKAAAVANPAFITVNNLNDNDESNLVKLFNVNLAPTATWDTTGSSVNGGFATTARTAAGANIGIFINKNSDLFLKPKPNFPFNIEGVALQSSTGANTGYFIWPRFIKDIDTLPQPNLVLHTISQVNTFRTAATPAILYGRADSNGRRVLVKGVVHSPNLFYGGLYFNLIDNTGAITVYNLGTVSGYNAKIGDSVQVRGTIIQPTGGLIVLAADSIKVLPKGTSLIPPKTITGPITKFIESYLLTLKKVRIVNPAGWDSTVLASKTLNWFEVKITDGIDTFFMDISKTTDLFRKGPIAGVFTVTGVVGENSTSATLPYNDHYLIVPRGSFDIIQGKLPFYKIGQIKGYNAVTGVADSLGVACFTRGVVQSGNINDSGATAFAIADNTGAITVANLNNLAYNPTIGDSIILSGSVNQVAGLTYFNPDSIAVVNTKNNILAPMVLASLDESDESALILKQGYTMWNPNQWDNLNPANKLGFNVQFVRGTDTIIVHISHNVTDLYNLPYADKPTGKVDITGIELQRTVLAKAPFANYYIVPRMVSDIAPSTGINDPDVVNNKIKCYPNPAHNQVNIVSSVIIENVVLTDVLGNCLTTLNNLGLSRLSIDMSSLKPGIYFIRVKTTEGTGFVKIVRE
jgi:hypothetical protein